MRRRNDGTFQHISDRKIGFVLQSSVHVAYMGANKLIVEGSPCPTSLAVYFLEI